MLLMNLGAFLPPTADLISRRAPGAVVVGLSTGFQLFLPCWGKNPLDSRVPLEGGQFSHVANSHFAPADPSKPFPKRAATVFHMPVGNAAQVWFTQYESPEASSSQYH